MKKIALIVLFITILAFCFTSCSTLEIILQDPNEDHKEEELVIESNLDLSENTDKIGELDDNHELIPEERRLYSFKKTDEGKYVIVDYNGIQSMEQVFDKITDSTYGYFICEYSDGKTQIIVYDENEVPSLQETENKLYLFVDNKTGNALNDIPFESYAEYDNGTNDNSIEIAGFSNGIEYDYLFENGEFNLIRTNNPADDENINGFIVFSKIWKNLNKFGIKKSDGTIIFEPIYDKVSVPFDDVILVYDGTSARQGWEFGRCNICDSNGKLLNNSYNYVEFINMDNGSYIGYAVRLSEAEVLCKDKDGNPLEAGAWFIDKDGNPLSEKFKYIYSDNPEDKNEFINIESENESKKLLPAEILQIYYQSVDNFN